VLSVAEALAAPAEQGALQVVAVLEGAITAATMAVEHPLDLLEGRGIDQRLVQSLALDAVQGHDADVVVVSEQAVEHAARERSARALAGRASAKPGVLQDLGDGGDRVVAGRGQVVGELHEVGAVRVDADGGDLAPLDHL
jgi:hypothetical protein